MKNIIMNVFLISVLNIPAVGFCIPVTVEKLKSDFVRAIGEVRVDINNGQDVKFYNTFDKSWNNQGQWISVTAYKPEFKALAISGTIPEVVTASSATLIKQPLYVYTIPSFTNRTPVDQEWNTEERTTQITNSFTYTNAENITLSASYALKVSASIKPADTGAGVEHTFTLGSSIGYTHTSSNTTTTTETITFPSQKLKAAPNGISTLTGYVYPVNFSGTFTTRGALEGTVKLYKRFYKKDNNININHYGKENYDYPRYDSYDEMSLYEAYKLIKTSAPHFFPEYLELDDKKGKVMLKESIENTFTGTAGYQSEAEVTFTSFDTNKSSVSMSLSDYNNPKKRESL